MLNKSALTQVAIFCSFLMVSSCGLGGFYSFIGDRFFYLEGLKKPQKNKALFLKQDISIRQVRGTIRTVFFAKTEQGSYNLIFESNEADFYYSKQVNFECEDLEIGGIAVPKDTGKEAFFWTSAALLKTSFNKDQRDSDYVRRRAGFWGLFFDQLFVHTYYPISRENFTITAF